MIALRDLPGPIDYSSSQFCRCGWMNPIGTDRCHGCGARLRIRRRDYAAAAACAPLCVALLDLLRVVV